LVVDVVHHIWDDPNVNNQRKLVMGLDMYLVGDKYVGGSWASCVEPVPLEDGRPIQSICIDLGYWRKHRKLHRYIVDNFAGGIDEGQKIALFAPDLRKIAEALRTHDLPTAEGFFFGSDEIDADQKKHGKEYAAWFEDAARWLERGDWKLSVYYQASW
jgi:hypothetical protein